MTAALEAGVTRLFRIGGAHAVAAMAYGTKSLPRVDKIVGPGNRYVAVAKAIVVAHCAIDFFAGPTEIVIVAASGKPDWVAADLVAQAEHDPDARSVLITWKRDFAARVAQATRLRASGRDIVTSSLAAAWRHPDREVRGRSHVDRQSNRSRASRRRSRIAGHGNRSPPGRCSSGRTPRRPPVITPRDRITCCRRQELPGFAAA